jgi:thiamine-monophosphate kinase
VRARLPAPPPGETWVGDDAAVLTGGLLFATDAMVDGVHFDRRWCTLADVGWKALAENCSDLAAMGGTPIAAVVAVVLPAELSGAGDALLDGLAVAATAFSCPLVGGDTTSGPTLVVSVAVTGHAPATGAVLRSGARAGDNVFVTGALGGAKAALDQRRAGRDPAPELVARMVRPAPRLMEGAAAAAAGATAMIDISDGFGADLGHVLDQSGVGVRIVGACIPCHPGASLDDALFGGDDYELCFTAPDTDRVTRAFADAGLAAPTAVGSIGREPARVLVTDDGERELPARGWEHTVG